jgi:hypothetical protein
MKTFRTSIAVALLLSLTSALSVHADIRLPQPSPGASVKAVLGVTDIVIDYHRPGVKGRKIWDGLVPYGKVWRLGANEATTISFSTPVRIAGKDVPAGKYALFAVPSADSWTIVLNKEANQWGAYDYKQDQDLMRFDVKPQTGPFTEWMVFHITPDGTGAATVEMAWENLRVPFRIEADVQKLAWKGIEEVLAGKPEAKDYYAAANYALTENQRLDDAMVWADKCLATEETPWGHALKARLLQKKGKTNEALAQLDQAIAQAKGKAPQEDIDEMEKLKAEWKKSA